VIDWYRRTQHTPWQIWQSPILKQSFHISMASVSHRDHASLHALQTTQYHPLHPLLHNYHVSLYHEEHSEKNYLEHLCNTFNSSSPLPWKASIILTSFLFMISLERGHIFSAQVSKIHDTLLCITEFLSFLKDISCSILYRNTFQKLEPLND